MKLRQVPAVHGARWVRNGFAAFFRRPLAFAALFTAFVFFGLFAALLPWIGPLVLLAALPLVSLGFMLATGHVLQGRFPTLAVFAEPLRQDRRERLALLKLGLLYAATTVAVMLLSDLADGGKFEALQAALGDSRAGGEAGRARIGALLADPQLQFGLLLRLGLAALLSLPFWHAPALVHWSRQGVGQALFSSTVACWRNKSAFAVYGCVWGAVVFGFAMTANLLAALLQQPQLVAMVAIPAGLLFSTVFYVSLYATFADCFVAADPSPAVSLPGEETVTKP